MNPFEQEFPMPAVTADTLTLPRIPASRLEAADRPVRVKSHDVV
jgi:hypothetical protein